MWCATFHNYFEFIIPILQMQSLLKATGVEG